MDRANADSNLIWFLGISYFPRFKIEVQHLFY